MSQKIWKDLAFWPFNVCSSSPYVGSTLLFRYDWNLYCPYKSLYW